MLTIWKYHLQLTRQQCISAPQGAELLYVGEQYGHVCLWLRCNTKRPKEERTILICDTGQEAPAQHLSRYIGTVLLHDATQVCHVFELLKETTPARETPLD